MARTSQKYGLRRCTVQQKAALLMHIIGVLVLETKQKLTVLTKNRKIVVDRDDVYNCHLLHDKSIFFDLPRKKYKRMEPLSCPIPESHS
jgi:hypothetical protein